MKRSQQRLVVVLGMHRSGTSAITRGLGLLGVGLGDDLHPAGFDNPKGFWEDRGVLDINEELLASQASAYDRLGLAPASFPVNAAISHLKLKASQLLVDRLSASTGPWGFKDPRTCRLLSFWTEIFAAVGCRVSFVIVLRNPASVAASLGSRNETPAEKSYWLWLQHMLPALRQSQGAERVLVDYDEFMDAPYFQLTRIANTIDLPLPAADAQTVRDFEGEFLETSLRHTRYSLAQLELDSRAPATVCELYRLLLATARDEMALEGTELNTRLAVLNDELSTTGTLIDYANALEDGRISLWRELAERDQRLNLLQSTHSEKELELATLCQQISQHDTQVLALHLKVGERDTRIEELNLTLLHRDGQVAALGHDLQGRDAQIIELHHKVGERDRRIEQFQGSLLECEGRIAALGQSIAELDAQIAALNQSIAERDADNSSLQHQLVEAQATTASLSMRIVESDAQTSLMRQNAITHELEVGNLRLQVEDGDQVAAAALALAASGQQIQALRLNLQQHETQILGLHQAVGARDQQIAGLEHEARKQADELADMERSKSWRLTKPLRGARRGLIIASPRAVRSVLSDGARQLWQQLPMSVSGKQKLKRAVFQGLPFLFRHTLAYRSWANGQRGDARIIGPAILSSQRENVLEPVTYVPLLQAKPLRQRQAKLICFYLPQYHAIAENDAWWGAGFTEWTNVVPAEPHFEGHYQPHVSDELGNYNLLDPAVQRRQVELAKLYGIEGFCFYFYWFAGHRLLETPILNYLNDSTLDLPFCLCWANENWSRRWDGLDSEILMAQQHSPTDDLAFIAHVGEYMRDPRYIRIGGKPLLLVYRPSLLPSAKETAQRWRDWCNDNGIGEIYLAYTQSFEVEDPAKYGFDAAIEFPPNNSSPPNITDSVVPLRDDFAATIYDWRVFVERSEKYKQPDYKLYRSVCPAWDNTARRKNRGTIFLNSSPKLYQRWLENAINYTVQQSPDPDQRLVFVNAWNEWAEGAHLEPDQRYGYAYLQATRDALSHTSDQQLSSLLLVTHDCHPHGAQFLILETAKELRDCGFKIYILALGGGRLLDDFTAVGDTLNAEVAGADGVTAFLRAISAAGTSNAITSTVVSGSVLPQLKQLGFKVLSLIHELPGVIRDMKQEGNAALIAAHADKLVFPADVVHQKFIEIATVPTERAIVRHQGVVRKNPYKQRREEAYRLVCAKHNLQADVQIVLSIAYMDLRKGPDLFVEIAAQVLKQRPNTVFVWIGHAEREMERQVKQRIDALNLQGKVILVDFERDPLMYYAAASVYSLTSREDPFPNVVLESVEAGAPVVAFSGTTGASEFILAHDGLLANHLDTADFALKVCELLEHPVRPVSADVSLRRYALDLLHHLNGFPRISVVVPNYKYERFIGPRLDSIYQQAFPVYEVIVLDDASPDGSVAAINAYLEASGNEAQLLVNETNSGSVFRQWKKGVDACTGDLVWIAEADDLTEPGFLQELATAFDDPHLVLAYCQSKQMDSSGTIVAESYLEYTLSASDCCLTDYCRDGKEEIVKSMCIKNTIPNVSAVLMRREAIRQTLEAVQEPLYTMKVAGDWLVYLHIMMKGKVCHSKKPLNLHRRHNASVTGSLAVERHVDEIIAMQKEAMRLVPPPPSAVVQAEAYIDQVCDQFKIARRVGVHHEAADVA